MSAVELSVRLPVGWNKCRFGAMSQIPVVAGSDQMTTQIEQVVYWRMHSQEALGLDSGFESPHTPCSTPRRLLRLLHPVIGVPVRNV